MNNELKQKIIEEITPLLKNNILYMPLVVSNIGENNKIDAVIFVANHHVEWDEYFKISNEVEEAICQTINSSQQK